MGAAGRGEEGAGVPLGRAAKEPHGPALGGRRLPRGSLSGRPSPVPAAFPGEAGQEGGRAPLPLAGHLSRPPSASAAGAASAARRKRSGPRGRTRRCRRLLGEPRLRPAGRERPSPLLSAFLFPPTVNFPELTLSLWLRGSGSSSSGTGRSRRRGAAPALPAGEGRSGGRAAEPGGALWTPARPGSSQRRCSRHGLPRPGGAAPHPRGWRRSPWSRRERLEAPELFPRRRGCPGRSRAPSRFLRERPPGIPGAAPRWQGAPLGAAFPLRAVPRYKEFWAKAQCTCSDVAGLPSQFPDESVQGECCFFPGVHRERVD
ncbi:translation initiation factor IF-2-like isoform X1 [Motacilla alba alba]|uniref:translation initiation factor IF-2-like isoform X1 n=1 Tax=Motacilla alba alba TaxID=1094192 RepID=UPI0018D53DCD|nr:translation initiation factor IF-2-like isoform X1 [Motacilla alba alba]